MRLFIGLEIGKAAREELALSVEELKKIARGNFVAPANLHITLQFLGEKRKDEIPSIQAAMRAAAQGCPELSFRLLEPGRFARGEESIFWYGIDGDMLSLKRLAAGLRSSLAENGVLFEAGAFKPHITLGRRVRTNLPLGEAFRAIKAKPAEFTVSEMVLFKSVRIDSVLNYIPVYRERFAAVG